MRLPHYKSLFYDPPSSPFQETVNANLERLYGVATGCGWAAISAQQKLKTLLAMTDLEREEAYQNAVAHQESRAAAHDQEVLD